MHLRAAHRNPSFKAAHDTRPHMLAVIVQTRRVYTRPCTAAQDTATAPNTRQHAHPNNAATSPSSHAICIIPTLPFALYPSHPVSTSTKAPMRLDSTRCAAPRRPRLPLAYSQIIKRQQLRHTAKDHKHCNSKVDHTTVHTQTLASHPIQPSKASA
jgi:hypothetical protein